ncbi:MAG: AraC family transcriptional regulator [Chitinophagaceae bacterium]|nr:MAG: AraC family transcriptional regulator [Chitinophagaceae bacterium]
MAIEDPVRIKTIPEFHRLRGLPGPAHPLVSVVRFEDMRMDARNHPSSWVLDFYAIALKKNFHAKLRYGQQVYDFDAGVMTFMAPGQKIGVESDPGQPIEHSGWLLIFHPDFLLKSTMAESIRKYEYFDYSVSEALFLSDEEEVILNGIIENIRSEYRRSIDPFTQHIIISQMEVLLSYAQRFYQRQFVTRQVGNHEVLTRLEYALEQGFTQDNLDKNGMPSVVSIAQALHISPNYLSGLLKTLTGKSTQQHIHDRMIELAKQMLSNTGLSISEVAYALGFSYPQSFSKLFKSKTSLSPAEFRDSHN